MKRTGSSYSRGSSGVTRIKSTTLLTRLKRIIAQMRRSRPVRLNQQSFLTIRTLRTICSRGRRSLSVCKTKTFLFGATITQKSARILSSSFSYAKENLSASQIARLENGYSKSTSFSCTIKLASIQKAMATKSWSKSQGLSTCHSAARSGIACLWRFKYPRWSFKTSFQSNWMISP